MSNREDFLARITRIEAAIVNLEKREDHSPEVSRKIDALSKELADLRKSLAKEPEPQPLPTLETRSRHWFDEYVFGYDEGGKDEE